MKKKRVPKPWCIVTERLVCNMFTFIVEEEGYLKDLDCGQLHIFRQDVQIDYCTGRHCLAIS